MSQFQVFWPQQFEFEARHFRDLTTESYVTNCAQIVVYHCWATQTALSVDWDTMGVAWVVRDPLWNASCARAQLRKQLVKSWAEHNLQASSVDMSFAPPLILARVYNMSNQHWVLRLLLIAPTREYLRPKFEPMRDGPHIVGANQVSWLLWIQLPSEKALNHSSGRGGQRFWMRSVPLHLQLHPCIRPSSSTLMVSVAIWHLS